MSPRGAMAKMAASALLFGLMAWLVRHVADGGLGGAQILFLRFATAGIVIVALAAGGRIALRPQRRDLLLARSLLGSGAALLYFICLARLPAGTTTLLHYSSPIWATLIAARFLGDRPRASTLAALGIASVGVVLVVVGQGRALGGSHGWLLLGVGSAMLSGAAVTTVRAARRHDSAWVVFAAFTLVGVISTCPPAFALWRDPTTGQWLLCLTIGVVSLLAQLLMTDALGVLDNATAGVIGNLTVLTTMTLSYLLDDEHFSSLALAGASLTILGVTLVSRARSGTLRKAESRLV